MFENLNQFYKMVLCNQTGANLAASSEVPGLNEGYLYQCPLGSEKSLPFHSVVIQVQVEKLVLDDYQQDRSADSAFVYEHLTSLSFDLRSNPNSPAKNIINNFMQQTSL